MLSTRHKSRRTIPRRVLHPTVRLHPGLQAFVDHLNGVRRPVQQTLTPPVEEEEEEKTADEEDLPVFRAIPRGFWIQDVGAHTAAPGQRAVQ